MTILAATATLNGNATGWASGPPCGGTSYGSICPPSGYYYYPPVGIGTNVNVGVNTFSPLLGETVSLTVIDPGHWDIVVNAPIGNTSITGYPSLGLWFPQTPLNSYSSVVSSFNENGNYNSGTISDTGYDLWFTAAITPDIGGPTPPIPASGVTMTQNIPYSLFAVISGASLTSVVVNGSVVGSGPGTYLLNPDDTITLTYTTPAPTWVWNTVFDVMLQNDISPLRSPVLPLNTGTFGGTTAVPVQINWQMGRFGREVVWQLSGAAVVTSGTVDVLAMITSLVAMGRMDPSATFGLSGYGFEICSTNGVDEDFVLNGFTWAQVFAEQSPALELSGFTISGPHPTSVINSVTVTITEHQSNQAANPIWFELWDYSGTPAQIGNSIWYLPGSTAAGHTSSYQFTGVTYSMLATLRVRIYGRAAAGTGHSQNVDSVALIVNYQP